MAFGNSLLSSRSLVGFLRRNKVLDGNPLGTGSENGGKIRTIAFDLDDPAGIGPAISRRTIDDGRAGPDVVMRM